MKIPVVPVSKIVVKVMTPLTQWIPMYQMTVNRMIVIEMSYNPNESNPNESNANDADDADIDSAEGDDADSSEINGSSNSSESKDRLRDNATNDMGDICDKLSSLCLPDTVARIANQLFQWKLESSKTVDRQYRKGSGRRLMTKTKDTRGRIFELTKMEQALEDLAQ